LPKVHYHAAEALFNRPRGRKHLESIVLILVNTLFTQRERRYIYRVSRKLLNFIFPETSICIL